MHQQDSISSYNPDDYTCNQSRFMLAIMRSAVLGTLLFIAPGKPTGHIRFMIACFNAAHIKTYTLHEFTPDLQHKLRS